MELIQQEILEQPALIRRRAAASPAVWPTAAGQVLVTGCGDSLAAAELCAALYAGRKLVAVPAMEASERARSLHPDNALIGISVSGRTPRVIEAVSRAHAGGAVTIAVTDDPSSELAERADVTWSIDASPTESLQSSSYEGPDAAQYVGYQRDVAQTKTFLGAVLAIARAAEGRGGATDWDRLAATVEELAGESFVEPLRARAADWAEAGQGFFLAVGSALPIARFAAYKMFELNRPAHWTDLEEYAHTQYFITRPGDALVVLVHDAASAARAAEIVPVLDELFDARCVIVRTSDVEPAWPKADDDVVVPAGGSALERHVALILAVQWVAYLWGRIGAPNIDTFHAGYDTERLVAASLRTIRRSRIRP